MADVTVDELSIKEARYMFDRAAVRLLGVSGDEFLAAYDAGRADSLGSHLNVERVAMLTPFAR